MNIKNYILITLFAFIYSCSSNNESLNNDENWIKAEKLLRQMTLEEKIGQMHQVSPPANLYEIADLVRNGQIGSVLNVVGAENVNFLQKIAVEESRLKIPLIVGRDVIHGFNTIFPIPLGQAASFNPELVEKAARVSAVEAASEGVRWTFTPMIDIGRDPRWGRIAESLGEDPYVTSILGVSIVNGFQGDNLSNPTSLASCPKHFVGYGAAEAGKDYNSTFIPERTLRNVYLPPFKAAVEAGAATFMTSFNDNDGIPASGNKFILDNVLREEWGFNGFVVSDWASVHEMINHGFAKDTKEAAEKAINAGVDMEMVSGTYTTHVKELLNEKKISMKSIDDAVKRILYIKYKLGLFENYLIDESSDSSPIYSDEHLEIAKEAAIQSAILLKNEGNTLPINKNVKTIAVIGPMADAPHDQLGTWVFDGDKNYTQTPLQTLLKDYSKNYNILYSEGLKYSRDKNINSINRAAEVAKKADIILAFVGEESILSGEAHSLANLGLQGAQKQLIETLSKTGKPLVTIVMAGRPLTIGDEVNLSDAVLYNFHPGTMGGPAIADLLFGKAIPSGKLPITFPKSVGQIPIYYAHNNTGRPFLGDETFIDDIPLEAGQTSLGNTSFHLDIGNEPLFPFGYGLSYTNFEYSNLKISSTKLKPSETINISIDVENVGNYDADEIVQLYVQDCFGSVTRPVKELKGFKRTHIKSGEKKTVEFALPISDLAFYNIDMQFVVEPGLFNLWVGSNSQDGIKTSFEVE